MKKQISLTGNSPSGYGHRKLTIEVDYESFSAVTSNMPMIDAITSDDDEESEEAQIRAMQFVCDRNEIDYSDAEFLTR